MCYTIVTIKGKERKNMTDIEKRIKELENCIFYLNMKDRWLPEDWEQERIWKKEINELKAQLK